MFDETVQPVKTETESRAACSQYAGLSNKDKKLQTSGLSAICCKNSLVLICLLLDLAA